MNGKERINTVLNGGIPDRVPYFDFIMSRRFLKYITGTEPAVYRSDEIVPGCIKAGIDAVWIPVKGFMGCEYGAGEADHYNDEFGTSFIRTSVSWPVNAPVKHVMTEPEDVRNYKFPEVGTGRVDDIIQAVRLAKGEIAVFAGIQGPLRTAWFLLGFENLCYILSDEPECLAGLFQGSVDFFKKTMDQLVGTGIDGIFVSEDMGFATGPFFSAEIFRKYIFPFQKEMMEHAKKLGFNVILHSDGNLNEILDDLMAMHYSAYHPFERKAAMDIFAVREKYPDTVLFGNIDSKVTLAEGDMDVIRRDVVECISKLGTRGRYILSSDHSINDGIDPDTIIKLVEIVKKEGRFPDM